jgi:uncharacterized membrane protein YheB (UPF0754 family)
MMFQPIEFEGRRPYLGWQGIIPRFAGRMAAIACDTLIAKLLSPQDLFDRLDPDRMISELEQPLTDAIEKTTEEVAARTRPELWNALPTRAKKQVMKQARRRVSPSD